MKRTRIAERRMAGAIAVAAWTVLGMLPLRVASDLAGWVGRTVGARLLKRDVIARNFRMAFPEAGDGDIERLVRGAAENIARLFAETARLGAISRREGGADVELVGAEYLKPGSPAIFVGPHLSNWEVGVIAISRVLGPINVMYTPIGLASIDRRLLAYRQQTGSTYLRRSRAAMRNARRP